MISTDMKIPVGLKKTAVLCVLKHGEQLLLLKRLKEPNKGMYTPVGGKLDPFESPLDAAFRETREETGIIVDAFKYCGVLVESSPSEYNWTSFVYVAEVAWIPAPLCNEGDLQWISFANVLNVPTPKTDWFIYNYILTGKPFAFHAVFDESINLLMMTEEIAGETLFTSGDL